MDPLISLLIMLVILVAVGWVAFWIIGQSVPAQFQMPARFVVGVILLIVLLTRFLPAGRQIF